MTRTEFCNSVNDWDELIAFCEGWGCYYCEDVFSDSHRDEYIDDCIHGAVLDRIAWYDLQYDLQNIPTGYDYYLLDGSWCDWQGLDDSDFEAYKSDVLSWGDREGIWDDDEEEAPLLFDEDTDEFVIEEEPISICELIEACNSQLFTITMEGN